MSRQRRHFYRDAVWSGGGAVFRGLASFVFNKLLALHFGPAGIALTNHYQNLVQVMTALVGDGLGRGLVKYVASEPAGANRFFWNGLWLALLVLGLGLGVLAAFPHALMGRFWPAGEALLWSGLFFLALLGFALHFLILAMLLGAGLLRHHVVVSSAVHWLGAGATVLLIYLGWPLPYLLVSYTAFSTLVLLPGARVLGRRGWLGRPVAPAKNLLRRLAKFLLMTAAVVIYGKGGDFVVREYAFRHLPEEATYQWQTAVRLSEYYLMPVFVVANSVFFPKVSALATDPTALRHYLRMIFRNIALVGALGMVAVFLLRAPLLRLFFSAEFLPAGRFVALHVWGDFFKIIGTFLGSMVMAFAHLRRKLLLESLSIVVYVLALLVLVPLFRVEGLVYAHLVRFVLFSAGIALVYRRLWSRPNPS